MVSITLSLASKFKKQLKYFMWVNWSEIAREETMKKSIFEKYMKTKDISDKDWKFCEKIDWHPVDELPMKKEFVEELERRSKEGKFIKFNSVSEIFDEK